LPISAKGNGVMTAERRLFCFGFGYSAGALAKLARAHGWRVAGTCQTEDRSRALAAAGIEAFLFSDGRPLSDAKAALAGATHVLVSVPPDAAGDPALNAHAGDLAALDGVAWVGYLSTTGVYGDTGGAWVDETAPPDPTSERGRERVRAERAWLDLWRERRLPVHVFRLAGIYGPGRSVLDQARRGQAKRIDRPGHLFSRIHVDDIARVLWASIARPNPGAVYNVCDDEPATPAAVTEEACRFLGVPPPPLVPFAEAAKAMSPMALSFWRDNRRVANRRVKEELGVALRYPNYRAGLKAILDAGG
jgi:nucleoside-diphosphate-sugar epimerase